MMLKFACLVLLAGLASASDVLEFTDANFDTEIKKHDVALVEFYAPWCGHCKNLAPEYEKAATTLKSNDPPVALVKVDCTAETKVCGKHGVSGYPTLKIFRDGEVAEDYKGPRQADGIVKLMKSKAGPTSKLLESVADAVKFLDTPDFSVVGYFEEGSEDQEDFQRLADKLSGDVRFAHTFNKDVRDKYLDSGIVLYRPKRFHSKFEDKEVKYTRRDLSLVTFEAWLNKNVMGLAGLRNKDNVQNFASPLVIVFYEIDYVKNPKGTNYWRNRVLKVAKKLKDAGKSVNFAISDANDMGREMDEFGLKYSETPLVAARNEKEQKFVMTEEFSMNNLESFVTDMLDGKLEAHVKSEKVPKSQGPVKVLVGKNFEEIITDEKDALIEFYAPWCGHCKNLEPTYDDLGKKMEGEDVVIAKIDATANDYPKDQYQVQGFPTIYWKPAGRKPVQYQGGRDVKDFITYIAKESTQPLKGYSRSGKKQAKTEL